MCGSVFHQHFSLLDGVGCGRSLLGSDFVERNKHGGIGGAGDVEERSGDDLHAHDAAFFKFRHSCGVWRVLKFGNIRRCEPFVVRNVGGVWGQGVGSAQGL